MARKKRFRKRGIGRKRFLENSGERYTRDGRIRCQAVTRELAKKLRRQDPDNFDPKDLWPDHQCNRAARPGYYVCYYHGAGRIGGPVPGRKVREQMKDIVQSMDADLASKYLLFYNDSELFNQRKNASLLYARTLELIESLGKSPLTDPDIVKEVQKGLDEVKKGAVVQGVSRAEEALNRIPDSSSVWKEIRQNSETIKNLTNAEMTRVKEMRLSLTSDQVMGIIDKLADGFLKAVEAEVLDAELQQRVLQRAVGTLRELIGTGDKALLQSPRNKDQQIINITK